VPALSEAAVESVLAGFRGAGTQVPPMYSALKRAGQPLYRLARAGVTVERPARPIELTALRLVALSDTTLELETLCSAGTYVRVLGEEIAAALGTLGHLTELRRLYVEPFAHEPMRTLEELSAQRAGASWPELLPLDFPLAGLPAVHLAAGEARRVLQGQAVHRSAPAAATRVRLYDEGGNFLGIGAADASGAVRPRRLLSVRT
ncbi:MAG: tRNA pseudouridine(55) synthase TruB, partial [Gammaproteobacteria bacterium]|nr:tRNA pseudouridine(55) synthase TruB [Gammaproteobacteria bacterium]